MPHTEPCSACGGRGEILIDVRGGPEGNGRDAVATDQVWETCGTCGGSGTIEVPDDDNK